MKILMTTLLIILGLQSCSSGKKLGDWSFATEGAIYSHPILDNNSLYFGSGDSNFYAVDLDTQGPKWIVKTEAPIQSQAIVHGEYIYFNNDKAIFALRKKDGKQVWKQELNSIADGQQLDPWDYHHGAPVIHESTIYFGATDGTLSGFDLITGAKTDQFITIDSAVVRCSPAVQDNIIYFGDWNGVVYAYDTALKDTIWSHKTYSEKLYATFGQLNTEFVVYDSLLIFGARNPELQVLNRKTGDLVWKYTSPEGGWVSGDPVVLSDTLFIGGSDNHKLFAFDVHNGEMFWEIVFLFNNFSKPLILGDKLLFTTGDAGNAYRKDEGYGYLYSVNRENGKLSNFKLFAANVFTSPVVDTRSIFLTSIDGHLYAVDQPSFLNSNHDLALRGYNSIELGELSPYSFKDSVAINYKVNNEADITLSIYNLESQLVLQLLSEKKVEGDYSIIWNGENMTGLPAPAGYYYLELNTGEFYQTGYVQKLE